MFLAYMFVGLIDMKRKRIFMYQCSSLILSNSNDNKPNLNLLDIKTIDSWYIMRASLLDFGRKYTKRVNTYASLVLPLCVFVILAIILQFILKIQIISFQKMAGIIYLSFISILFLCYIIVIGSEINKTNMVHRDILINYLNDNVILNENESFDTDKSYRAIKMIIKKLEQDDHLRPLKILGFKADYALISNLLAVFISGIVSIFQSYLN